MTNKIKIPACPGIRYEAMTDPNCIGTFGNCIVVYDDQHEVGGVYNKHIGEWVAIHPISADDFTKRAAIIVENSQEATPELAS